MQTAITKGVIAMNDNDNRKPDFAFHDHGSLCLLVPLNAAAQAWADEHIAKSQEWGGGLVIEPRYCGDIIAGAQQDGLIVEAA